MESTSTITIASLASIIGLGILRMVMNSKGFKFSFSSGLVKFNGRVGQASPTISIEDEPPRRSFSNKRSASAPTPLEITRDETST